MGTTVAPGVLPVMNSDEQSAVGNQQSVRPPRPASVTHGDWKVRAAPHLVVAFGTAFAILMMCLCCWSLYQSRQDSLNYYRDTQQNIAIIIERDVEHNFELYALSLDAVVRGVKQPEVMALPVPLRRRILFDRAASARYLESMLVLDAAGNIVLDSESDVPRTANFADRPFFEVHRGNTDPGLYISDPYHSPLAGGSDTIALTRRLSHPDGSFAGVALLSIQLEYFRKLFSNLQIGANGSIALLKSNGTLAMRLPEIKGSIGRSFLHSSAFQHFVADHGTFTAYTQLDGVRRFYVYRRMPGLPLIVSVASAESDIYGNWYRRATVIGALMALSGIGFIALSIMLGGQLRRRLRAETELNWLARTDSLTGLNNRRTLGQILDNEWQQAQQQQQVFSLLFVDIDYFKAYNDTYGHQAGDQTLTAVAHSIAGHIRPSTDSAGRYGGEEFIIVLPDADTAAAQQVAQRLLSAVSGLNISHTKSPFGRVTVSIGAVSWLPDRYASLAAVIKAADDALYHAKAAGRNHVSAAA